MRNWFAQPWAAPRYAAGRPDVHGPVADRIAARVGRVGRALDVGCGTGLSLRAIADHAERTVGVDPSTPMLREARATGSRVVRARAERLPLSAESQDLVTIACAWHWCEPRAFQDEAARVLRPGGWLVVYDSRFRARPDAPELLDWLKAHYWSQLEWVPRNPDYDPERHRHPAFEPVAHEVLDVLAPMTQREVRTLITSQASTIANVETGTLTLAEAETRLDAGLAPHWPDPAARHPIRFSSPMDFLRRRDA